MGITGARDAVSGDAGALVARIRRHTDLPVAVGLGVSNGVQAAQVAAFADGVIVGSAFVRRLLDARTGRGRGRGPRPGRRSVRRGPPSYGRAGNVARWRSACLRGDDSPGAPAGVDPEPRSCMPGG